jgi:hypothetical protein
MAIRTANLGVAHPRALFNDQLQLSAEGNLQFGPNQLAAGAGATIYGAGGVAGQVQLKAMCGSSFGVGIGVQGHGLLIMSRDEYVACRAYERGDMPGCVKYVRAQKRATTKAQASAPRGRPSAGSGSSAGPVVPPAAPAPAQQDFPPLPPQATR